MITNEAVKQILTDVAVKEYGELPWRGVSEYIDLIARDFVPTERPVLASVKLDNAVTRLRRGLETQFAFELKQLRSAA